MDEFNLLLSNDETPTWFVYPRLFIRIHKQRLVDLEPWIILEGERLRIRYHGLKKRYAARELVPFARREDNDDVACWERGGGDSVVVIHDFETVGFENGQVYGNFWDWFRGAIEEMIEYEPE